MALQDVDINNLELGNEQELEGFDPGTDFFTSPPPPDDATYVASLKLQDGSGVKKGTDKNGRDFYQLSVEARIKDGGKFDNRPVFDRPNTIVLQGSNRVAGILQALKITPPTSAGAQVKSLVEALAGEPQVKITTRWRSAYKNGDGSYKELFKGQRKHPEKNGRFSHINQSEGGDEVVAQAEIIKYAPIN